MTVYVDPLMDHGWQLAGERVRSCHLFTDTLELGELHALASEIRCKRTWFQDHALPHYDLTEIRRRMAVACGAEEVTRRQAVEVWRKRRAAVDRVREAMKRMPFCGECPSHLYCNRIQACGRF